MFRLHSVALALLIGVAGLATISHTPAAYAQSNISGDLSGSVSDASGAIIPNAQVTVTSEARGDSKVVTSDAAGNFRVPLLSPGRYQVSVTAPGFATATAQATISAGVITPLSIKLTIGQATTTIEVSADSAQLLHVDDAQISTTFDLQQIQSMPNPGNDLTFVAQTAPGAVMNTQGGYGNFSTNGLPATSNTFTVNGGYEGDPYLNLNNSGATNLLLGNNDVDSVTVTTNSYDAAFGGLGGAQVNEISRSGSNRWHGNLAYWWNGRAMNANSYFNKQNGHPRNFTNANQWAAAIGGPIKKDKIFGFIDTEGIRVIIPVNGTAFGPSPAYQAAILGPSHIDPPLGGQEGQNPNGLVPYGNLAYNGLSSEAPLYQKIFSYYNNAKNWSTGAVDPNDPDSWIWTGTTTNFGREWLINGRVDFNLRDNDHLYIHFKDDHGVQPTATSFLDPVFDAESPQPSYEGQLNETHTFSSNMTNQFLFGASYYRAIFTNTSASSLASTIPFVLIPEGFAIGCVLQDPSKPQSDNNPCIRYFDWDNTGNSAEWIGGIDYALPQGRNVTGYQFTDDLTWLRGKHNWKFGYAFRRDDITDYTSSEHNINYAGGENIILDQSDFAAGFSDEWAERFPQRLSQPVALYVSGWYAQDQWKPTPGLTLTLGLRMEHNSNPLCQTNCVSNYANDYASLPTATSTAYNTIFASGRHQAFFEQQNIAWEPRFGFSYLPGGSGGKTSIRGGFGMFADYFPAQIMGNLVSNIPEVNRFTVLGAAYGNGITLDATRADSGHAQAVTSNNALSKLYGQGACYKGCDPNLDLSLVTKGVFSRPTVVGTAHKVFLPTYEEWSFAVEREVVRNTVLAVNYIGNRTYHQPVSNSPNAYDPYGTNATLPGSRPNAALGSSTEFYSGSYSNFNGLIATVTSRVNWLTTHFNYAYGHALDTTSNGGFDAFGVNPNGQINPNNLHQQYGNADYDTRHYISANYSIAVPYKGGPKVLTADWEIAGTIFHNTGYPFSVQDSNGTIIYGAAALAQQTDNNFNHHCGGGKHTMTPCDFASHFASSTDYGQQGRNQLYGPNYTDFDLDIQKGFRMPKWESARLKVGAQFFNTFNHPNFQIPLNDVNYGPSNGIIYTTANTPTSILGAFLGGDASPRLIQLKGTFVF
jgi:Carboxypeptidase regulatory-like domain